MILICGAGITGLTIAKEILNLGIKDIVIFDKEPDLGKHASGRNSGVLHAGIYYTPETLKARFCLKGNQLMKQYCKERGLTLIESGKVIVTKKETELPVLYELYKRAKQNGAEVELVDSKTLKEIEPYAKTYEKALYSPLTAIINPREILISLENELKEAGIKILKGVSFKKFINSNNIETFQGKIQFEYFINSAGAYADKIAHSFGLGLNYRILPFKGLYKKLRKEKNFLVKGNIYPVPDIRNPFLGVHFTKIYDGTVYVGPTATPALGRENYKMFDNLGLESLQILWRDFLLFMSNEKFRNNAFSEIRKYSAKKFYDDIKDMLENITIDDLLPSSKVGIRPQLIDIKKKELVMDFVVLKESKTIHILNAISPAFTSAFAFAEFIVKEYFMEKK
ncbi:MAG: L-2-hydroxyglutarate oxidase [Thermodesulfovibrio sp.]|uniref:L-2-hydroxyglutarate oxidase n=1 Tax=unclassified Thermodesulfovibrio TaxID=2645936 RepID=UPI00083AD620|nr:MULTISPECIES: L-2-hydroxyglutarate oxidase [unclassified Thermodesulfovibrio]MDI1471869.1 L-2-hydroxyglutarate oxidase [Thermodesulfovibrio sp. 1176]MDI6714940.1 L-2-hydroxyglutarate oxidase [Thermodesulfovibrio sp.]ODA44805.1 FAD-dependent oxidoreductase [Thermodesulfovibrio sp. N1]